MLKKIFLETKIQFYIVLIIILISLIFSEIIIRSFQPYSGEVSVGGIGAGIYWDENCDNPITNMSWGKISINPLQSNIYKNITIYIKNESNRPITLKMNITDLNPPSIKKYISIKWNYEGNILQQNEIFKIKLTLALNANIWFETPRISNYDFKILILAI